MKKVLIPTKLDAIAKNMLMQHGAYDVIQDEKTDLLEQVRANPDVHAIIVRSEKVTAEIMDAADKLKVVVRAGAGYNTIDIRHARKKGIDVMNTPGANSNAVAEEVVAFMLADARHIVAADASCRAGLWEKSRFMGREITGKVIGIVGLGYIGQLVAKRLAGFDMTVLGYDPFISHEKAASMGLELVSLPELFERSDYVTLHLPENDETRGMVNSILLSNMKDGATLINCARSGIVDENALREVKPRKNLRFLNDVYPKDTEGPKPVADVADLMLPHLGASTKEANRKAAELAAKELIDLDDKGVTSAVVNRDVPMGLDPAFAKLAYTLTRLCRQVGGGQTTLKLIETSFYGSLKPFAQWLLTPVATALSTDYDTGMNFKRTVQFLKDMGLDYVDRDTDTSKGYTNSITIDLTSNIDPHHLVRASVRGTVEEGNLLIARINDFDKLYIEPTGRMVVFSYEDRPGVLAQITLALADAGINIDDVRNPHDTKGKMSLAILKVNKPVPDDIVNKIAADIQTQMAFYIEL